MTKKKKTTSPPTLYPFVYVDIQSYEEEGPRHDCKSDWCCRPDTSATIGNVKVSIQESPYPGKGVPDFVKPGATVWVLIEDYSDGDTFGHDANNFESKGVFPSYEDADKASQCMHVKSGYFQGHNGWIIQEVVVD